MLSTGLYKGVSGHVHVYAKNLNIYKKEGQCPYASVTSRHVTPIIRRPLGHFDDSTVIRHVFRS